jgi:alpha-galactosidase
MTGQNLSGTNLERAGDHNQRVTLHAIRVSGPVKNAGYQYVIIDDCWHGERDPHGDIQPDAKRFPEGIKELAAYVHGLDSG